MMIISKIGWVEMKLMDGLTQEWSVLIIMKAVNMIQLLLLEWYRNKEKFNIGCWDMIGRIR